VEDLSHEPSSGSATLYVRASKKSITMTLLHRDRTLIARGYMGE
jgi:hypothetical protein